MITSSLPLTKTKRQRNISRSLMKMLTNVECTLLILFGVGGTHSIDGTVQLLVRYGSKPLEFERGKIAIETASRGEVAGVLAKLCN